MEVCLSLRPRYIYIYLYIHTYIYVYICIWFICRAPRTSSESKKNQTSKTFQTSPPKPSKIFWKIIFDVPKTSKNTLLELSWAVLAPSWVLLATRGPHERKKVEKSEFGSPQGSIFGGFSGHVGAMLGQAAFQERVTTTSCELVHQGLHLTRQLGPTWPQYEPTWAQLGLTWPYLRRFSMSINFGGHVDTKNSTKIITHFGSPKSVKFVRRHHGSTILKVPRPSKIL